MRLQDVILMDGIIAASPPSSDGWEDTPAPPPTPDEELFGPSGRRYNREVPAVAKKAAGGVAKKAATKRTGGRRGVRPTSADLSGRRSSRAGGGALLPGLFHETLDFSPGARGWMAPDGE